MKIILDKINKTICFIKKKIKKIEKELLLKANKDASNIDEKDNWKEKLKYLENEDIQPLLDTKVDKEEGKGLSTNDFTTDLKDKLEGLKNYELPELLSSISRTDVDNWNEAHNKEVIGVSITGDENKTLTITFKDGTTKSTNFVDLYDEDTDIKLNSLNWNADTGVLTAVTSDGATITTNIDGRYSLLNHTHNDLAKKDASNVEGEDLEKWREKLGLLDYVTGNNF